MTGGPGSDGLVVGITGATGAVYGIRLLERLRDLEVPTHLIVTTWGKRTIEHETGYTLADVGALATTVESFGDLASVVSSGSYRTRGMAVVPCSVNTLASVSAGLSANLLTRAADVTLKEQRKLVLVVRETPLSEIHLENMLRLARMGVVVMPPVPAFYNFPSTLSDVVDYTVTRVLDQFGLDCGEAAGNRWDGRLRRN